MRRTRPRCFALLMTLTLVVSFTAASGTAEAYTGTPAGDPTCPGGFLNQNSWGSNICFYGYVQSYDASNLTQDGIGLANGSTYRAKVSMYTGSPCSGYLEGGEYNYTVVSGGTYYQTGVPYDQFKTPTGSPVMYTLNINWGPGGTVEVSSDGANQNFTVTFTDGSYQWYSTAGPLGGVGGCISEAGVFVQGQLYTSGGVNQWAPFLVGLSNGGLVQQFSQYRIDNPCSVYHTYCMNGAFVNNSTGWNASIG